jgi:hypothetical protein
MISEHTKSAVKQTSVASYITSALTTSHDILLFDSGRGYYMPTYPVTSIDEAISDITSLSDVPRHIDRGE